MQKGRHGSGSGRDVRYRSDTGLGYVHRHDPTPLFETFHKITRILCTDQGALEWNKPNYMIKAKLVDKKVLLSRDDEDRKPLVQRLARIEGQVRGIRAMIEDDRYCGDELHQVKAAMAALREFAVMLSEQHIMASIQLAAETKDNERIHDDITRILRDALRL